ncbi:UDP-GalNAc:beta-1,3-N-acetylgalactosaminyltransferase 1 [Antechinus flavipes]|uniref:UDP-GalNAc:beta-1, 3-N-acetylgalactosaminyltransferase 1 n=1 Tax=Antechinus flavipes TaxID=38775 RepID=UPI0022359652|nr:UDP-GalNAc:beta-1,3-N-acetylgalactosaminyltransferase 1 [Antechinus flavipes]XP_051839066.1 UDP-GalNAc:beta-1,3-N-acetylgalactosaminyltransferase 1 [Antechinus flavipes]XP_051839067.1 UDP-GalNAc:beta-1,3-N-acetylgalactosaminyltransferase 1 [Antechinus flavipes]XP_051839068.1 UDP-GalNAc:beta-1,3-N-acetylgalactosaminyltransferase 1 [Antechinus flavipes]XP_051839069.1 UDP-GalNAc:beta-1,3-N-acetylgalactosaminyltransferase 1 [Antechinus flavipes]
MSVKCLRWSLWLLCFLTVAMLWYLNLPSYAVIENLNWMYFYEYTPVNHSEFAFTLRERETCSERGPFLVILVTSRPADVEARQAIRVTWGAKKSWWGQEVLTFFLLGRQTEPEDNLLALSVQDESILYGDIIRQDFIDSYDNLTLKTIMAFRWVTEFCPTARYVMKADSDVFINTGNLVKYLLTHNQSENFYTGYPLIENFSNREFFKKTYISYQEYPFRVFPPYCSGLGYVLSGDLVSRVYGMMAHVRPFRFEDVYVGITLSILKVDVHVPESDDLFFLYRIKFNVCKFQHLIAAHDYSPRELIQYWQLVQTESSC